jgi:peptidoglycan/xylan/chitin deacetylase (PgdA/CDA1 family)
VKLEKIVANPASGNHENEIALTFDDGLRNNLTVAYPILRELNIPAVFFVCPGLIENGRWLWTHEARARLRCLDSTARLKFVSDHEAQTGESEEEILRWMKSLLFKQRAEVEKDLRSRTTTFCPSPEQRKKYDLMNWDELRSLDSALVAIGSHTVNHPILPTLQPDELSFEISASRRLLEEKLGRPVDAFCYPNGSYNKAVLEEVRKTYRAAVSTEVGFVNPSSDPHCLPRIGVVPNTSLLAWRMHRPTA